MTQKILLTPETDDSQLDQAQTRVDKLVATLKEAEELITKLVRFHNPVFDEAFDIPDWDAFKRSLSEPSKWEKEKPPEGGERNLNE